VGIDTTWSVRRKLTAAGTRVSSSPDYDVTIIGAGPYGLSAAAYLKAKGLGVRVFGESMEFWANKMPQGMLLRSPREASTIADPQSAFTLEEYESASRTSPTAPVRLETFVEYGRWFRHQLGSDVDATKVAEVSREGSIFKVRLEDGGSFRSRRVVVAAGIGSFHYKPAVFAHLPGAQASHCYEGRKIAEFAGKRVVVIGAGQSALESAALLHEAGAQVEIIARIERLRWIGMHSWLHHMGPLSDILYSKHDIGPAGISRLVANPNLVFHFPLKIKDKIRRRAVRSAGSRWLPARLAPVKITTGRTVQQAQLVGEEVELKLDDGSERRVDHVLLGTGYRVDVSRYAFLSKGLVSQVRQLEGYPEVTAGFCSSVPGLHFIGAAAARSFGPLLYFVTGTEFTSKQLSAHVSRNRVPIAQ
jgi:lysine/ornithine N-monooxygenase